MRSHTQTTNNALFPSGLHLYLNSSDAEEMEEQSAFWRYDHKQFGKGKFKGEIVATHTRNLQLALSNRSTGIIVRGGIPAKATIFLLPTSLKHSFYYRGQALRDHEIVALNSEEEFELQTSHQSSVVTVAINSDFLDHQCINITGKSLERLRYQERLLINPIDYDDRIRSLMTLLRNLHNRQQINHSREEELIENTIVEIILSGVIAPGIPLKSPDRLSVAKRAEEYIRKNLKNSISIHSLCRYLGTSERTLHQGFKERFGVSPKAYMQTMRLNGVRMSLLKYRRMRTVADTALEWGFLKPGWFSEQYKKMFGELPSETKRILMDG